MWGWQLIKTKARQSIVSRFFLWQLSVKQSAD
jgi:hypothetical protein